jgi:hypothetical protein
MLALLLATLSLFGSAPSGVTLYEDGSGTLGPVTFCLPSALCTD